MHRESPLTHTHTHHRISILGGQRSGVEERKVLRTYISCELCVRVIWVRIDQNALSYKPSMTMERFNFSEISGPKTKYLNLHVWLTEIELHSCFKYKHLSVCKCNPFEVNVSQVYRRMSGNDYFVKKPGEETRRGRSRKIGTAVD